MRRNDETGEAVLNVKTDPYSDTGELDIHVQLTAVEAQDLLLDYFHMQSI